MDERQQHLMAAANALRAWIHQQKAGWDAPFPSVAPLHTPAFTAAADLAAPSVALECAGELAALDVRPDEVAAPAWSETVRTILRSVTRSVRSTGAMLWPHWRLAGAVVAIVALAGF